MAGFFCYYIVMSWSSRRRTLYSLIVLIGLTVIVGVPLFYLLYEEPTCFDGKQNQNEVAVDCGGSCELLCDSQVTLPAILWSRSFSVTEGVYNAVAHIENSNFKAGTFEVPYIFKLFDSENILVAERRGITYISPNSAFSVFEGGIITGERVPVRTFFEFKGEPEWFNLSNPASVIMIENRVLSDVSSSPTLDAIIKNTSVSDIKDIEIIAIIFDTDDNAIASSRTIIDVLPKNSEQEIAFTWPKSFTTSVGRVEIIPRVYPTK